MQFPGLDFGYEAGADLSMTESSISCQQSGRFVELAEEIQEILEETRGDPNYNANHDAYRPKVEEGPYPAFSFSYFLVSKHPVQRMHNVPPFFFFEAESFRESPFWGTEPGVRWRNIAMIQRQFLRNPKE